jgi:threonine aldolase
LAELPGISLDLATVQTNIIAFEVQKIYAAAFVKRCADAGVRVNAIGQQRLRAVTHLDVSRADIDVALKRFASALHA